MELWEFLAFEAEALIVGQMEVEDVHLDGFHAVEIALEYVGGNEVAADVNEQAAPGEARLVLDGKGGSGEAVGSDFDELQESLQSA